LQIKTEDGSLPLHLALSGYPLKSLETIQVLVEAWPDAVHAQDNNGRLPLHHACQRGCTDDEIQFLVRSWPESCQVLTKDGQLALHLACGCHSSSATLILLDCYPQAVRFKDKSLHLPLHIACMRESAFTLEVIERLVRAWPESVRIPCPYDAYDDFY